MAAAEQIYEGSCLCGKVRYRIAGKPGPLSNCHCTDCRKSHGAAFATYLDVPRNQLTFLQGEAELQTFRAESGTKRSFCRTCGSIIRCWSDDDPNLMEIAAGTLDTRLDQKPLSHIWVRSKVPWYEIQDGQPQHSTHSPS
ncbi:MAG: GFA family protein [Acidobacteriota bacterium]